MSLRSRITGPEEQGSARPGREDGHLVAVFRAKLLEEIDLAEMSSLATADRRARLERVLGHIISREGPVLSGAERTQLIRRVVDEALGLGVLEPLLEDPSITEIMVNGPDAIFVERAGRVEQLPMRFASHEQLMQTIERIVSTVNRRVDESHPMVDARLPSGERVNVIIPPLSLTGATLTIRRFPRAYTLPELIQLGSLDEHLLMLLAAFVRARLNVIVSGGTGSGKTTLLNALSGLIPGHERIITIEDSAELQLQQAHVVRLESRPANVEGKGHITIRDLVRNSLRMRPDRIIVGEVRGGETLDMLQAMSTGHDGSLATVHANSAEDALMRLQTLGSMAEVQIPFEALRDQINSAVDVVVQLSRGADGSRRLAEIAVLVSHGREPFRIATVSRHHPGPRARTAPPRAGSNTSRCPAPSPTASTSPERAYPPPSASPTPPTPPTSERRWHDRPHPPRPRRRPALSAARRGRRPRVRLRARPAPGPGRPALGHLRAPAGRGRRFTGIDRRVRRTRLGRDLSLRLSATGLDVTVGEFTVYALAATAALWLIASAALAPFFGPIAALAAAWGAVVFLNWQRQKRIEAFINQLPDVARLLANATAAGLALRTALAMAAEELEAPAGEELSRVADQLALGRSVDAALGELAERLPSRELVVLVTTLVLSNQAGGTVVSSLRNLTATLEERKETRREVRTMLSEVHATALTVPALGLGSLLLINSQNEGALARVTGSALGQILILIALGLYAVGFLVIRRLGKIEV